MERTPHLKPAQRPKSKRGPKPKKGARQPKLSARLTDPDTEWKRIEVNWYGGQKKEVEIATRTRATDLA